jgi:hypothetical protein
MGRVSRARKLVGVVTTLGFATAFLIEQLD